MRSSGLKVYTQRWTNGKVSYHLSQWDVEKFAQELYKADPNSTVRPLENGLTVADKEADHSVVQVLKGKHGIWRH